MSFLTLEFAILFLKVLNIDFPLILVSLNVVERSLLFLLDLSNRWCKWKNVEPDALKEWKINIFKIINTHISFTLVIHIFYPLNLNILFVILNKVSRIFI